ncbi:MAG TPA: energy transducer TonB [Terracidiphilus sp.]|nr:energy transducer TonB [Terracidiphilus sp.]
MGTAPMKHFCIAWAVVACSLVAVCQSNSTIKSVSESDARSHLLTHEEAIYPPIAKAAQIQGDIVIALTIDPDGKATALRVLSGPAMLQQAALDAVKTWSFKPFDSGGVATAVTTTITINFQLYKPGTGPSRAQEEAAQAYFPLEDKCRTALKNKDVNDSLSTCKAALDMSIKAGDITSSDQLGMMNAHQLYGHALLLAGKPTDALEEENSAIAEAKKCLTDTDEEYAMPFYWRATAEAQLGQANATFADLNVSEETLRRAIQHLPEMKKMYSQYLASILNQHAAFLDQLGRTEEAGKLRAEAASL